MRVFLIFLILLLTGQVFAYDLVLPREKKSTVNTNYAFFLGKAKNTEVITINDEKVFIAPNGAFAHSVKLKDGENRIVVKSNFNTQIYKIRKNKVSASAKIDFVPFEAKNYIVKKDNTPLRSTPIDYGMNRVSHLFKDTVLIVDGFQGDFYRVKLSKNKFAWIMKSAVEEFDCDCFALEFTGKLPYTIDETDKEIIFKVYNPFKSEESVYTVNIKKPEKYSYKTELCGGKYNFKVNYLPEQITVVVDAGHGGSEKGAVGCLGDKEKDINLKIALELKEILSQAGVNVIMTRECDANVSLDDRVKIARENCANIFVSVHLNSIPDIKMNIHKNRGTSVYYYNPNSKELAQSVLDTVSATVGTRKDGVRTASFAVIRPADYVGILVETAYMTNPLDSVLYKSDSFAKNAAQGIADGILHFVN